MISPFSVSTSKPEPFEIAISDAQLDALRAQIDLVSLDAYFDNLLSDAFSLDINDCRFGIPPVALRALISRLKNGFDWRKQEQRLNDIGQHYKIKVDGLPDGTIDMHFIHVKSKKPDAVTIMLVHGWPGSFVEFEKISHLLSDEVNLVIPSLPGYTFSSGVKQSVKGRSAPWGAAKTAACCHAVMTALGVDKYLVQGGDWGSMVARTLAQLYPDHVKAIHLNFVNTGVFDEEEWTKAATSDFEKQGLERSREFKKWASAYANMQGTVPYTLGAALSASPIALVAYLGEKFYRWSAPDSHPSEDEILTNILLYWFTQSITSSFWLYQNRMGDGDAMVTFKQSVEQPVAYSCGAHEISWPPESLLRQKHPNLISYKVLNNGGHFLALEKPEILAREIREFVASKEVQQALSN